MNYHSSKEVCTKADIESGKYLGRALTVMLRVLRKSIGMKEFACTSEFWWLLEENFMRFRISSGDGESDTCIGPTTCPCAEDFHFEVKCGIFFRLRGSTLRPHLDEAVGAGGRTGPPAAAQLVRPRSVWLRQHQRRKRRHHRHGRQ